MRALLFGLVLLLAAPTAGFAQDPIKLVAFGDSLTAGYQLGPDEGFAEVLQARLREQGHDVEVVNAGVSGDTTSGGLSRLDWSVPDDTDGVILELGGNDALRGIDPSVTRDNLDAMLTTLGERDIPVLLAGMLAPPNMGPAYQEAFNPIFGELAETHDAFYYPFFLEGVAGEPQYGLGDGIHPNAEGVEIIVDNILPVVEDLIAEAERRAPS
ncbi:arylesterase [Amorphus orientalis]|uniref:Acyl-CoA thioesterase-1 n=1 Tax=Amorphus orientalis TaxID=649198 RepID=A0AAE3VKC9_9HYPH|nr:arylesterase [Amorphus orientalis]MDQ0313989.1 acyl-CoA thioesterase-1 [Amorphus orientalis]